MNGVVRVMRACRRFGPQATAPSPPPLRRRTELIPSRRPQLYNLARSCRNAGHVLSYGLGAVFCSLITIPSIDLHGAIDTLQLLLLSFARDSRLTLTTCTFTLGYAMQKSLTSVAVAVLVYQTCDWIASSNLGGPGFRLHG